MAVIVLYDHDCGLCRWAVAWVLDRDRSRLLEPVPIRSPAGDRLLADLDPAARLESMHVVTDAGRRASGGPAVRLLLGALPALRPLARAAALSPRLTDAGYTLVVRHRSRISRAISPRAKLRADRRLAARGSARTG